MNNMITRSRISLALFMALLLNAAISAGQAPPSDIQVTVAQMNRQAMDAYANMQIDQAIQVLHQAEAICLQYNQRGSALARTYLNLGVIEAGGKQNNAAAIEHFKKAICLDPTQLIDPMLSSPDVEMLFNMARSQAQAPGVCDQYGGAAPPPQPPPTQPPGYPPPPPNQPVQTSGLARHQPVSQQMRLTPVPIFVEINPQVEVGRVILFYRTVGERIFQQVQMNPHGEGYAATIGCDVLQTFDPTGIEYYIALLDEENQLLGTAGTEAQPFKVAFVQAIAGPPPALPGEQPPSKCQEECPPWNPDCNRDCKKIGDLCDSDSECCTGMACVEETCTPSEGGGEAGPGGFSPIFRIALGFGTGIGVIPGGSLYPYNQTSLNPRDAEGSAVEVSTGMAWSKFHFRVAPMFYIKEWLLIGVSFRGGLAFSPDEEVMPLAPLGLLDVGFRVVGKGTDTFELDAVVGLGGGIIQHRVPYKDCAPVMIFESDGHPWWVSESDDPNYYANNTYEDQETGEVYQIGCGMETDYDGTPILDEETQNWIGAGAEGDPEAVDKIYFRKAGKFAIEAGVDTYFWVAKNFGFNIGLMFDILVPDFAFNIDAQLGIALRF